MRLKIVDIDTSGRFRKDLGDTEALAKSIEKNGLLHLPVVTTDGKLVCGYRRLDAAWKLGWTEIDVRVIDPDILIEAENDENEVRKAFTPSERTSIAKAIEERLGERKGQRTDKHSSNCDEVHRGRTKKIAATKAGFPSQDSYQRASKVVAKGSPELVDAMDSGAVSISAAATVADLPKEEQAETVAKGPEAVKERAAEIRKSKVNGQVVADPPDIAALRAAGKIAADVVVEITEPKSPEEPDEPSEQSTPEAEDPQDLSDEAWLAELPLTSKLGSSRVRGFHADALDYRRTESARKSFHHAVSRALKGNGEWAFRVRRLLRTDHPKHWLICPTIENGGCGGSGEVQMIGQCPKCRGRGYYIR